MLELMIAIVVFAIAGTASLNSYLLSARHLQMVNDEKVLTLLSRRKIEELKGEKVNIKDGVSGSFDAPFEKYTWQIYCSDTTITDTEYEITFTPYGLKIKTDKGDYSVMAPFLKINEREMHGTGYDKKP